MRMCGTPHCRLRTRHCDSLVLPFVDLLISSCNLEICNPREQATHVGGGELDCVFISRSCAVPVTVHSGDHCCDEAPCPLLGSDHFLCVARSFPRPSGSFEKVRMEDSSSSQGLGINPPPCTYSALLNWSSRLDALLCDPLTVSNRFLIVEEFFQQFDLHSPVSCIFSMSAPSSQTVSLTDVGVFRSVCDM